MKYYQLAKPGIIFGNVVTAAAGFLLAAKGHVDLSLFFATLFGLSCVIGSACAFNNYIDRKTDKKMARTRKRALVQGTISPRNALVFATALSLIGFLTLALYTNFLATAVALTGFLFYVAVYSHLKYRTVYGTVIGSISGAAPPVVGYCAVSHHLDLGAGILFILLVLWQMPHFFAIAMVRIKDYTAASIPVLPVKRGVQVTKIRMLLYVIAFLITAPMLTIFGYTGYAYGFVAAILGAIWLGLSIQGFKAPSDQQWARHMFLFSLVTIITLSITISLDVA
jgi:protoheme IX farnesyltransferase